MINVIKARIAQGFRTMQYPDGPPPELPQRFAGWPQVAGGACLQGCHACAEICPTAAITVSTPATGPAIDIGRCIFCRKCQAACPAGAIVFGGDFKMARAQRSSLRAVRNEAADEAAVCSERIRRVFGRSLKLRQVSAGGCNACEADTNVLSTLAWDLGRFGIQFVASPRHADGILVTGPVTVNMREALLKTYNAVPEPRIVIAAGTCAISGGLFAGHPETLDGADGLLPVDLYIPGCPPHPLTILEGLLWLIGRVSRQH